jgi:hypothetical protein
MYLKFLYIQKVLFCWVSVAHACNPTREAEIRRLSVPRPAPANSWRNSISKITRAKWTGGVAQAVEHLLCKPEVLSSNSSPRKRKKKFCPSL